MIFTKLDKDDFISSTICHICEKPFIKDDIKVRDHCHFTGKFRGVAHKFCNLKCCKPRILPVIFHKLQGYDGHLFIKELAKLAGDLSCIPSTEEKYISFSIKIKVDEYFNRKTEETVLLNFEIRFIDSFIFMQTSLANLVNNLQKDEFNNLNKIYENNTELSSRKGVYPYDYVNSIDKFNETKLPPIHEFYSKLYDTHISEEDYNHAQNVFKTVNRKAIKDYHNLYLKSDVLLLADVFENFHDVCLNHYKLNPAHYFSSPGLALDACLKETKQKIQLMNDYDMLIFFEKGIRGGMTHTSKRYSEANNKYTKDYNPKKEV